MCISQLKLPPPPPPPPRHLELSAGEFNISLVLKKALTFLAPRAMYFLKSQGARDGAVVRELPPMWPRFRSLRRRHMWVAFVVGCLPCSERFFSGYSGYPLSSKTRISKFQFDQELGRRKTTLWMRYLQIIIYLFHIYLFICIAWN